MVPRVKTHLLHDSETHNRRRIDILNISLAAPLSVAIGLPQLKEMPTKKKYGLQLAVWSIRTHPIQC